MGRIQVDPDALRHLANQCGTVASQLDALGRSVFDSDQTVTGSSDVSDALDDFHDVWSDRRRELQVALQDCASALDSIALSFSEQDEALTQQLGD